MYITPMEPLPWIPVENPYAITIFPCGTGAILSCTFKTPCGDTFAASVEISAYTWSCSYSPSNRTININRAGGQGYHDNVQIYTARLFNDYGLVTTISFDSNQSSVQMPLRGLPSGNYYINVIDSQNNIIDSQYMPVN